MNTHRLRTVVLISAASLVLGITSTAALAAASGPAPAPPAQPASCTPPALAGSVVDVAFTDMGAMMGPGMMGGSPMMGPYGPGPNNAYPGYYAGNSWPGMGMMQIGISPTAVAAGQVSLRVANRGWLTHEVVVLPLDADHYPGQRPVGTNREVDETGSLGEASQTCSQGQGEGIAPGTVGWTTMTLPPGRYELLCNIAGHYGSGMYTELDVTPAG